MAIQPIHAKTAVSASRCILVLALGWHLSAAPAAAAIGTASLSSTGSNSAVLTFSHSGYRADNFPFGVAKGYKYRVCWSVTTGLQPDGMCLNTSSQEIELTELNVGLTSAIKITCFCSQQISGNLYGPPGNRTVANLNYTHQLPPSPPGLVSSVNVRVRGVQSGQCLFINSSNSFVRGWQCWADPAMVFALETFSDGSKRLHHAQSGRCITATAASSDILALPCGGNGSKLMVLPQPGGPVLVRFLFVSGIGSWQSGPFCLVANAANGQNAGRQNCNIGGAALPLMLDPV